MNSLCGLHNLGNTCFMNAALQLIVNCTVLTKFVLNNEFNSPILNIYKTFLKNYMSKGVISPSEIKRIVSIKDNIFAGYDQQDSHEFLVSLLELLENEMKEEHKTNAKAIMSIQMDKLMVTIFDTLVSSIIYSEESKEKSKNRVGEKVLSLSIPNKNNVSLNDCLDNFTKIEKLVGDEQWYSEKLEKKVDAYKKLCLKQLPKYLLIHLKRYSFFSRSNKNNSNVNIPLDLKINNYNFKLRGLIIHSGGVNGGHYVSIINKDDKWFLCNDSRVIEINNIEKHISSGYMYLYVKQKN